MDGIGGSGGFGAACTRRGQPSCHRSRQGPRIPWAAQICAYVVLATSPPSGGVCPSVRVGEGAARRQMDDLLCKAWAWA